MQARQRMDLKHLLFGWRGRITRQEYLLRGWLVAFGAGVAYEVLWSVDLLVWGQFSGSLTLLFACLSIWMGAALAVKRLHDLGYAGWWLALGLVPPANLWLLIELVFFRGQRTENPFGPPPETSRDVSVDWPQTRGLAVVGCIVLVWVLPRLAAWARIRLDLADTAEPAAAEQAPALRTRTLPVKAVFSGPAAVKSARVLPERVEATATADVWQRLSGPLDALVLDTASISINDVQSLPYDTPVRTRVPVNRYLQGHELQVDPAYVEVEFELAAPNRIARIVVPVELWAVPEIWQRIGAEGYVLECDESLDPWWLEITVAGPEAAIQRAMADPTALRAGAEVTEYDLLPAATFPPRRVTFMLPPGLTVVEPLEPTVGFRFQPAATPP